MFLLKIYRNLVSRELGTVDLGVVNFKRLSLPLHLIPIALRLGLGNKSIVQANKTKYCFPGLYRNLLATSKSFLKIHDTLSRDCPLEPLPHCLESMFLPIPLRVALSFEIHLVHKGLSFGASSTQCLPSL